MSHIERAVDTVLFDCLGVTKGETVVVVTDPNKRVIAEALIAGARAAGAEAVLVDMIERPNHGAEPPAAVAAAMLEADVLIAPTSKSLSHTEARRAASARGTRAATMPGITEDMLVRTMGADYGEIRRRSSAVAQLLSSGREVKITSEAGTDITILIEGRDGVADDGDLRAPSAFGNLPAGEGFIAPIEGATNGRIAFDGSIWPVGILEEPLVVDVVDGYATDMSGPAADKFRAIIEPHGRDAFAIAELGVGTNPAAILTGNVLEDEKIMGTIHIALGDNHTIGGTIRVPSHEDGIVLSPAVEIDGTPILRDGSLLL
ncbi:MAG: aminopeptidase [Actinomycetota bacterium]